MKVVFGTMTFGDQVIQPDAVQMLGRLRESGITELDSAHVYNDGATEAMLGEFNKAGELSGFSVASKMSPWVDGGLSADSIDRQLQLTLQRLAAAGPDDTGETPLDLLYLHAPDLETDIEATLACIDKHYRAGVFRRFGLSNYAAWQVAEIVQLCRRHGWVEPSVYQGMYNALTRDVERELFLCLAHYGIAFYVYNPLAGGFLSGKYENHAERPTEGRFVINESYLERYWKAEYIAAVQDVASVSRAADIHPAAAALRWLQHHSALSNGGAGGAEHAIIVGASSMTHLDANLHACEAGALPASVVESIETAWERVRPWCIKYFRP